MSSAPVCGASHPRSLQLQTVENCLITGLKCWAEDTLAERLRLRPAKPMGSPRVGSNPTGVDCCAFCSHPPCVSQFQASVAGTLCQAKARLMPLDQAIHSAKADVERGAACTFVSVLNEYPGILVCRDMTPFFHSQPSKSSRQKKLAMYKPGGPDRGRLQAHCPTGSEACRDTAALICYDSFCSSVGRLPWLGRHIVPVTAQAQLLLKTRTVGLPSWRTSMRRRGQKKAPLHGRRAAHYTGVSRGKKWPRDL